MTFDGSWQTVGSVNLSTNSLPQRTALLPHVFTSDTIAIVAEPLQEVYFVGWLNLEWNIQSIGGNFVGIRQRVYRGNNVYKFATFPTSGYQVRLTVNFWASSAQFNVWEMLL